MTIRVLYSSFPSLHDRTVAEAAVRDAIGVREGAWTISFVQPPHQSSLWVVQLDGPNGFARSWAFDAADQHYRAVRTAITRDLSDTYD
jgi:hypothetical protein